MTMRLTTRHITLLRALVHLGALGCLLWLGYAVPAGLLAAVMVGLAVEPSGLKELVGREVDRPAVVRAFTGATLIPVSGPPVADGVMVVRDGPQGCWIQQRGERRHVPGFAVKAVDSNGAGDAHAGVFVAGLAQGLNAHEAARRANLEGAAARAGSRRTSERLCCCSLARPTSSPRPAMVPTRPDISAGTMTVLAVGLRASSAKASTYFWATK